MQSERTPDQEAAWEAVAAALAALADSYGVPSDLLVERAGVRVEMTLVELSIAEPVAS